MRKSLLVMTLVALLATSVSAHTLFMNLYDNEDGTVTVMGMFSTGSVAANTEVRVESEEGKVLIKGKTDADGEFQFDKPDQPYTVVLDYGSGHVASQDGPRQFNFNGGVCMRKTAFLLALAAMMLWAGTASAHMFWVNLTESRSHLPGHVLASLGFGHTLPLDDFLVGAHGAVKIGKYQLVSPDMKMQALGLPDTTNYPSEESPLKVSVTKGDLGLRKVTLSEEMKKGTYQVVAESEPIFFTQYTDKDNKERMAPKSMDRIKDISKVLLSIKYQAYAKTFFSVGEWSPPKPMGYDLEILPLTDLSDVHVGDLVDFMVTFRGKPVNSDGEKIHYLTAMSNTFGGPDGFCLGDMLIDGKATYRMPAAGQWMVNIFYSQEVANNPALADLKDKCGIVHTAASVSFEVKPQSMKVGPKNWAHFQTNWYWENLLPMKSVNTKFIVKAPRETKVGPCKAILPEITGSAFITAGYHLRNLGVTQSPQSVFVVIGQVVIGRSHTETLGQIHLRQPKDCLVLCVNRGHYVAILLVYSKQNSSVNNQLCQVCTYPSLQDEFSLSESQIGWLWLIISARFKFLRVDTGKGWSYQGGASYHKEGQHG
eukprot:TRINITY_DN11915_c0_g2_i2.p1 TRINITY_DN11915_c0_g2~~TRINITY_DN11915_c0_g2_i2.p1  ORF type:complete len:604 (-),score=66.79 TRINITY_DN11915_c0_g2_i2:58-1842(-)